MLDLIVLSFNCLRPKRRLGSPLVEGNMGKFKVRSVYSNPEENSCLNACVLLRSKNIEATPDLFTEFSFVKGVGKVKLGRVYWW